MKEIGRRLSSFFSRKFIAVGTGTFLLWEGKIDQFVWLALVVAWAGFSTIQKLWFNKK